MTKNYILAVTSILFFGAVVSLSLYCLLWGEAPLRWIIYYGENLTQKDIRKIDLAILDSDHISPLVFSNKRTKFIGYLSLGEAEEYRWFWPQAKGKDFVVEKNPYWPGSWRVDIRSQLWQALLLNQVIPKILEKGYRGLFLDTVDTAIYLENKDPGRYAGSKKALIGFVKEVRSRYPHLMIVLNNGFEILEELGGVLDAVAAEDLYTRYDFKNKTYIYTPSEAMGFKENLLDAFRLKYKKPVLNIIYAESADALLAKYAVKKSSAKGYLWYVTTVDLRDIGDAMR